MINEIKSLKEEHVNLMHSNASEKEKYNTFMMESTLKFEQKLKSEIELAIQQDRLQERNLVEEMVTSRMKMNKNQKNQNVLQPQPHMSAPLDSSMRLIDLNNNITTTINNNNDNNNDNNMNDTLSSFHVNNNNSLSPSSSSSSRLTTLPAASHDSQQNQDERVVLLEQEAYRLRRALENDHKEKLRLERSLKWHTETLGRYFFFLIFLFFSFFFFHS